MNFTFVQIVVRIFLPIVVPLICVSMANAQYPEQRLTFSAADETRPHWNPANGDIAFLINDDNLTDANCCLTSRANVGMVSSDDPGSEFLIAIFGAGPHGFATTLSWIGSTGLLAIDEGLNNREVLQMNPYVGAPWYRYVYDGAETGFEVRVVTDYYDYGTLLEVSRDGAFALWGVAPGTVSYGQNRIFTAPYSGLIGADGYSSGLLEFEDLPSPAGTYIDASIWPSGTHYVVSIPIPASGVPGKDLWIYPVGGAAAHISDPPIQITHDGQFGVVNMDPEISPDNLRIAFARDDGSGFTDLYIVSESSPAIQITNTPGVSEHHPTWSPDGSMLAFTRFDNAVSGNLLPQEMPNANIYLVTVPADPVVEPTPPSDEPVVYDPAKPIADPPIVEEIDNPNGESIIVVKMPQYELQDSSALQLAARLKKEKKHKIMYEVQLEEDSSDENRYRKTKYSKQNEVRFRNVPEGTYRVRYQVHEVVKRKKKRSSASTSLEKNYKVVSNTGYSPDTVYVRAKD